MTWWIWLLAAVIALILAWTVSVGRAWRRGGVVADHTPSPGAADGSGPGAVTGEVMMAGALAGMTVVTSAGVAVGRVKDVVFDAASGRVTRLALVDRGLLARPLRVTLPWEAVYALGSDAVMIRGPEVLIPAPEDTPKDNVVGARAVADDGHQVGRVADVLLDVKAGSATVSGFEVRIVAPPKTMLVPVRGPLAASARTVVLSGSGLRLAASELAAFPAAVRALASAGPPTTRVP
ncbi:PRC-barrel domain-containing protein [Kitasatospora sp. NBC_00070]|uniref:PRC-barrel domain-containing protein n=1 Tax=Kitasatospora sp. NBC_00070 TaxID=2975962 RepID=UPI0032520B1A